MEKAASGGRGPCQCNREDQKEKAKRACSSIYLSLRDRIESATRCWRKRQNDLRRNVSSWELRRRMNLKNNLRSNLHYAMLLFFERGWRVLDDRGQGSAAGTNDTKLGLNLGSFLAGGGIFGWSRGACGDRPCVRPVRRLSRERERCVMAPGAHQLPPACKIRQPQGLIGC